MRISLVAAVARNGVIGADNAMPWRLSSDFRRFKALTLGKPVVMGRKTFASIGRPLPERTNIVVTRDAGFSRDGVLTASSFEEALRLAGEGLPEDAGEVMVIGGGEIYRLAMPLADRLYVTHVEASPEGDTYFPTIDPTLWRVTSSEIVPAGPKDSAATEFVIYDRITAE